ncbi:MAG: hypothetical protein KatS3mg123_2296 [Burkholderiales bacterium]|nr:MAG: hypothetical protein KatS3mg123_2296 [Burkholderiales bacterium]
MDLDGPAFLVRCQGRADVRYPLARVSRVIASAQVEWSARALAACLESGIPVVITGSGNAPVGYLLPGMRASSRLSRELGEFIDRPDWKERYADWLRAERMRVFAEWQRRRESTGNPLPQEALRELKRRYVYLDDRSEGLPLNGLLSAAIRAAVAEQLQKAGLSAVYWGFRGEALHLLEDVSRLLELVLHFEWHGLGEAARFEGPALLRVFHAFARALTAHCNSVLGHLHRYVKSFLEEWR